MCITIGKCLSFFFCKYLSSLVWGPSAMAHSPSISIATYPTNLPNHQNHAPDKRPAARRNWGLHCYGIDAKACTGTKKFLSIDTRYPAPGHGRHPRVTLQPMEGARTASNMCAIKRSQAARLASACLLLVSEHGQTRTVDVCRGAVNSISRGTPRPRVPTVPVSPIRQDKIPTEPSFY